MKELTKTTTNEQHYLILHDECSKLSLSLFAKNALNIPHCNSSGFVFKMEKGITESTLLQRKEESKGTVMGLCFEEKEQRRLMVWKDRRKRRSELALMTLSLSLKNRWKDTHAWKLKTVENHDFWEQERYVWLCPLISNFLHKYNLQNQYDS